MNWEQLELAKGMHINRAQLLSILQTALDRQESRFARDASEEWLNSYPYDLHVEYLRAAALAQEGKRKNALQILMRLVQLDPEFIEAQSLLLKIARRVHAELAERGRSAVTVLERATAVPNDIELWAQHLLRAQMAFDKEDYAEAEGHVQAALNAEPSSALPAIMHTRIARQLEFSWLAVDKLIELYRSQWPEALQFKLMDAERMAESGLEDEAVELLHECAALDVTGQVAKRLWGHDFRFQSLWPKELSLALTARIPAKVAAGLGWNHLNSGQAPVTEKRGVLVREKTAKGQRKAVVEGIDLLGKRPETPVDLDELTSQTEHDLYLNADTRFPSYLAISSRSALKEKFGRNAFNEIDAALRHLVTSTSALPNWDASMVYVDDAESLRRYQLQPVDASNPWAVKNLIADLDEALRQRGEMIGAMLIVGGPEIIPFHHLPNPVDDDDKDVPSDNPYASIDENYFVPSWPLGRLPEGQGNDASGLIKGLQAIAANRMADNGKVKPRFSSLERIMKFLGIHRDRDTSFGYSAEIWRRASHSVYRPIGEPRGLSISPPTASGKLPKEATLPLELAYFNLHGLEDTADWYGQRDPIETREGPDYPVALSPGDVVNSGRAPQIVFTEACFGANIIDKNLENAISLKFLASGTKAVIGSTCTSYGSLTTPLIAADLLGQTFWKLLNEGHPAGEALRRAKIALAKSMHHRQGYLDGEDQKTLIQFVLYGDPLAQTQGAEVLPKRILRAETEDIAVSAVCDKSQADAQSKEQVPEATMETVRAVVAKYLPGMAESQMTMSHEHLHCDGHDCPIPHGHVRSKSTLAPNRHLVTLSKRVRAESKQHPSYARITMDSHGKVVKLAVSR